MSLIYSDVENIVHAACSEKLKSDVVHRDDLEKVLTDVLFRFINSNSVKQQLKNTIK